jgi:hypothetical protein
MDINLTAVLAATVAMFVAGAFWYGAIFGKQWGKIHGFDKLSEAKQKELQSKMAGPYAVQLVVTFFTAWVLAYAIGELPDLSIWTLAFWAWLGFILPTQYSAFAFGGAPEGYVTQKLAISAAGSLAHVLVGVWVLSLF